VQGVGFDHPEQTIWRDGATTVRFITQTHGDTDAVKLTLSTLQGCQIEFRSDIAGYAKFGMTEGVSY
jgi:hypothetical protein